MAKLQAVADTKTEKKSEKTEKKNGEAKAAAGDETEKKAKKAKKVEGEEGEKKPKLPPFQKAAQLQGAWREARRGASAARRGERVDGARHRGRIVA
jgi:hypothetical protein